MAQHKAQDVNAKPRTVDVQFLDDIDFKLMLLPTPILQGLKKSGYLKPSPIQRKALPLVRCGLDLIVQAKAGTGKTCVFTVAALELVVPTIPRLQAVILAPTREIAQQITAVITAIGQDIPGLKVCSFVGGYALSQDVSKVTGCHIAVGTPGRMRHLVRKEILNTDHVRLFVLDEADKLMEKAFVEDINEIFSHLPESKQVLACSATYTTELMGFLSCYMYQRQYVTPIPASGTNMTVLVGIKQYISVLTLHVDHLAQLRLKENHLLQLLCTVPFNQCLVFSNLHSRAVSVCNILRKHGWSVAWIAGRQEQADRVIALSQLKEQRVRVLVTTDLTARGIDVENVNLIINLDVPTDHQTYLHRMGRAGRYGSHGMVITVVSSEEELAAFQRHLGAIGGISQSVSKIPEDFRNLDLWTTSEDFFEKVWGVVESKEHSSKTKAESRDSTEANKNSPQKGNEQPMGDVLEENSEPQELTDTEEKFFQESTDSVVSGEIVSNVALDSKEVAEQSEDRTDTDEKYSQKSSDEIAELFKCDEENVPANNDCSCNILNVQQSDIAILFGPSIFCSTKSEEQWYTVLPVLVHESKIPLNTPLILLDSKFIRVKSLKELFVIKFDLDISGSQVVNFDEISPAIIANTARETNNFLSFEEIAFALKTGIINLKSYPYHADHGKIFSFNEIGDFIDSFASETKFQIDEEIRIKIRKESENMRQTRKVLSSYENRRKKLEIYLKCFDCFDIVGWMAVDVKCNILEKLKSYTNDVFEFVLVKCHGGKDHIKIIYSIDDSKEIENEKTGIDQACTYNLNAMNLTAPFSMDYIKQVILNKNPADKLQVQTDCTSKKVDIAEDVQRLSDRLLKKLRDLKKSQKTDKSQIEVNTQNKGIPCCSSVKSKLTQNHKRQDSMDMTSNQKVSLKSVEDIHSFSKSEQSAEPREAQKRDQRISSAGSEDSDSFIDLSQYLLKWNELQDLKYQSDSVSSSSMKSDILENLISPKAKDEKIFFDSSSDMSYTAAEIKKQKDFNDKLLGQMKTYQDYLCKITNKAELDDCGSLESDASNHNCSETASEQQDSGKDLGKVNDNKSCKSKPSNNQSNKTSLIQSKSPKNLGGMQDIGRVYPCNSNKSTNVVQLNRSRTQKRHDGNQDHNTYKFEQYQDHYQNQESKNKRGKVRTLHANNLFSEWYSSWYAEVRQRALQLEMTEYIKTMSTP